MAAPPGLFALLCQIAEGVPPSTATLAALEAAAWEYVPEQLRLLPLLPASVSAHEIVDALAGADACGLGPGPLGLFAARTRGLLLRAQR